MPKRVSLPDPTWVRLGDLRGPVEAALNAGRYERSWTVLVRNAVKNELLDPLSPEVRESLWTLARFLGLSADSTLRLLLDRYRNELRPPGS